MQVLGEMTAVRQKLLGNGGFVVLKKLKTRLAIEEWYLGASM